MIPSKQQQVEEGAGEVGSQQTPEHAVCTREQPPIDEDGDKLRGATADGEIEVKLDWWHGMDRAIRPTHKAHGASGPWKVSLRDTMSIPDPVALAKVRAMVKLHHPAWTLKEIDRELHPTFPTLVLPHVPRLLPNPDITLALYDIDLYKVYGAVLDATTGEVANSVQSCICFTLRVLVGNN